MNCQKLIDQIEKYKPYNEQEEKDKILILDWIRNNKNAFLRENTVAHMTASAWVVNKERNRVLITSYLSDLIASTSFSQTSGALISGCIS